MIHTIINMRSISVLLFLTTFFLSFQAMAISSNSNEGSKPSEDMSSSAELQNTYWRLTEIDGEQVVTKPDQREMKLTLHVEENKANGYGGCNSFFGTYTHDADSLTFGPLAATRKYCADSMDRESLFFKLLSEVASYTIDGQVLHLNDSQGKSMLKLEAVYLK